MATAAQIQAELAAGPQTQEALDAALLRYSPAEMAAAFPQYGSAADYANAAAEAAVRAQQNAPAQQDTGPTLTAEQRDFITWQGQQISPITGRPISDTWASQGITDPFADPRLVNQAQEQIDRAGRREDVFAQAGIAPGDLRPWSDAPPPTVGGGFVTGGGAPSRTVVGGGGGVTPGTTPGGGGGLLGPGPTTPTTPATPAAPVPPRIQAIRDWYAANAGQGTQGDLNRWLATSGYTAREINAALPQWGLNDLQNAMRTAIGEVAQQTPFAPVAAQPMQPLVQPYTSIASQLPGGADTRMQEIRNWYAANEGRGTQADLDRWLASGYTAQEINRALPQWGVADLDRAIAAARQAFPQAEVQSGLTQYQAMAPGAQYVGAVSPYGLLTQQMQPFQNPYADTLANIPLGGYNPGVYNVLLDETVDPVTGMAIPNEGGAGGASGGDAPGDTAGDTSGIEGGGQTGDCVDPNVLILLASGASIRAGDIKVGDMLHTIHEETFVYGDFPVEFIQIIDQPKVEAEFDDGQKIIISTTHKFLTAENEWKKIEDIAVGEAIRGLGDVTKTLKSITLMGNGPVVKMTVTDAHTYIADGLVSHNKYNGGLVTAIFGPDPAGPDEGQIDIQRGEYVIKKSSVKKYGAGLLDMINEGKIPAKKMKSLLG